MGSRVVTIRSAPSVPLARTRFATPLALGLFVVGLLVLTGLPAAYAQWTTPVDRVFMGIVLNVPDTAQYLSWARESASAVLIENKLTPESGAAIFFNLFWFVAGRVAALLGLDVPAMLQVARLVAGAVYLLALFWFVGLFSVSKLERWTSFLVITLGGGLGWLLVLYKQLSDQLPAPLLLYVIESNTFLTLMAFPHQAMATGLMVLILGLAALAFERDSLRLAILAGLLAVVLGAQHGYDLLHVYVFVGLTALLLAMRVRRPRPLVLGAAICIWSLPAAVYLALLTRVDPIWRGVLAQYGNAGIYTPAPALLLVALGLPLIVLIIARPPATEPAPATARELLLRVWLVAGFLLLYVPTDFQIKMLAGWQVPLGILATRLILRRWAPAIAQRVRRPRWPVPALVASLLVLLVIPVNLYLFSWRFVDLGRHSYPYSLSQDEVAALHWLDGNAAASDVIFSSLTVGQYVPSLTGSHAYLAHWAQTLDFYTRRDAVARFYDAATPDAERRQILNAKNARFVIVGPAERELGAYQPSQATFLEPAFKQGNTAVYRLREGG